MARRSEHSQDEIRKMVLQAAESIVINEGYSALNTRKIAMKIGYTVGSIYMVYTNMADLILHIKARTLDEISQNLQQVQVADPAQALEELAVAYLNFANLNYNRWCVLFEYRKSSGSAIDDWYQDKIDKVFVLVEGQLSKLSADRPKNEIKQASRSLWSGVHGVCVLSLAKALGDLDVSKVQSNVLLLVRSFIKGFIS
jgi:AcrR family transcriptional regulator